jgi:dihydroxyacetone synthase
VLREQYGIKARVVSFPCQRLFEKQDFVYRQRVLKLRSSVPRVVIEAYAVNGWERYADAGYSMSTFGHSLPGAVAYKHFGFDEKVIAPRVKSFIEEVRRDGIENFRGDFRDLNVPPHS